MRTPDYIASLAELDVLSGCSLDELRTASALLTRIDVPAGTVVLRESTVGREFLIVARGELSVTRCNGEAQQLLSVVSSGSVVGEMALLNRSLRTATVSTQTSATLYAGTSQEFFALLEAAPSAAERIVAAAAERERSNRAA